MPCSRADIFFVQFVANLQLNVITASPTALLLMPFTPELREERHATRASQRFRPLAAKWQSRSQTGPLYTRFRFPADSSDRVAQSRHVLLAAEYLDLAPYARIVGKVVEARDAFTSACTEKKRLDRDGTKDPIAKLVKLVASLRDNAAQYVHILA